MELDCKKINVADLCRRIDDLINEFGNLKNLFNNSIDTARDLCYALRNAEEIYEDVEGIIKSVGIPSLLKQGGEQFGGLLDQSSTIQEATNFELSNVQSVSYINELSTSFTGAYETYLRRLNFKPKKFLTDADKKILEISESIDMGSLVSSVGNTLTNKMAVQSSVSNAIQSFGQADAAMANATGAIVTAATSLTGGKLPINISQIPGLSAKASITNILDPVSDVLTESGTGPLFYAKLACAIADSVDLAETEINRMLEGIKNLAASEDDLLTRVLDGVYGEVRQVLIDLTCLDLGELNELQANCGGLL